MENIDKYILKTKKKWSNYVFDKIFSPNIDRKYVIFHKNMIKMYNINQKSI